MLNHLRVSFVFNISNFGHCKINVSASLLCLYTVIIFFYYKYNRMNSTLKQTNCKHSRRKYYGFQLSQ